MSDFNPYAAPESKVVPQALASAESGVWRQRNLLVMTKDAELPDRCVKCNAPADGIRLKRNYFWHPPFYYVLLLLSPLIYIIVAVIVQKRATVQVGLCEDHRHRRRVGIAIAWVMSLAGIGLVVFGLAAERFVVAAGVGILLFLIGVIWGIIASRLLLPTKIDDRHVWLKNVNPDYLAELPEWMWLT